jgi:hypothetical protein
MFIFIIVVLTLFSHSVDAKSIEIKNWTTIGDIVKPGIVIGTSTPNMYVLIIDKDVIDLSKENDLSDIRIIDKDKNEIPYTMVRSNQDIKTVDEKKMDVKIVENILTSSKKRLVVIDTNREGDVYNSLTIYHDPNSVNFRKKVNIYISDSLLPAVSPSWKKLEQKNIIYNYTDSKNFTIENLDVALAGISSRFIKIEFVNDTDFDKNININSKFTIDSIKINYQKDNQDTGEYTVKDYLSGNFSFPDLSIYKDLNLLNKIENASSSELTYEGGIDVKQINLNVDNSNTNFDRNVVIQGSNDDVNWQVVATSSIYRINSPVYKGENLSINIPVSTYKKFKVIVQNNNNKALNFGKIIKAQVQNVGLLFDINNNLNISDLKIIVGNNIDSESVYDIKNSIDYSDSAIPQIISYQNLIKNPEYIPIKKNIIPLAERDKVFLNIGLLAIMVIIGIFGFFWMKKENI